jgi:hypothetical protein
MRIREILDLKGGTLYSISPDGLLADAVSPLLKQYIKNWPEPDPANSR